MKKGDIVVVPRRWGEFDVYRIVDDAPLLPKDIDVSNLLSWGGHQIIHNEDMSRLCLHRESGKPEVVDLGFFRKVEPIMAKAQRSEYADARLTARMKARQTSLCITDIKEHVDKAIEAEKKENPISVKSSLVKPLLDGIKETLNPVKLEELVEGYFKKLGASTEIPAKNERDKEGDADVIATFDAINTIIYVQVKKFEGIANERALEQIVAYKSYQEAEIDDDYTRIAWVVSTADGFSKECKEKAAEHNVLLINGEAFVDMILEHSLSILD